MDWTPDDIAQIKVLWAEGLSGTQIGHRMNRKKSSIVGKAHRLGLPARPSPLRSNFYSAGHAAAMRAWHAAGRPNRAEPVAKPRPPQSRPPQPSAPRIAPPPNPVERYAAMGTEKKPCEFLIGDERPYKACTADRVVGKPFCPDHCAQSYIKIRPRQMTDVDAARVQALADIATRLQQETEQCL